MTDLGGAVEIRLSKVESDALDALLSGEPSISLQGL
jgi:hypothetical protein